MIKKIKATVYYKVARTLFFVGGLTFGCLSWWDVTEPVNRARVMLMSTLILACVAGIKASLKEMTDK